MWSVEELLATHKTHTGPPFTAMATKRIMSSIKLSGRKNKCASDAPTVTQMLST